MAKRKSKKAVKKIIRWYQLITCAGQKHFSIEVENLSFLASCRAFIRAIQTRFEESKKHNETFHNDSNLPRCKPRFFAMAKHR